jgi:hypothetical protein
MVEHTGGTQLVNHEISEHQAYIHMYIYVELRNVYTPGTQCLVFVSRPGHKPQDAYTYTVPFFQKRKSSDGDTRKLKPRGVACKTSATHLQAASLSAATGRRREGKKDPWKTT